MVALYNEECVAGSQKIIGEKSIDLIICDPPFGIDEKHFQKHYYREDNLVIDGYVQAPSDYFQFSLEWIRECKRILKDNGSLYIVSGWSNLHHILNAIIANDMHVVNHIIWKYNFGVFTRKKYVSSHYHILYITKLKKAIPTFNTYSRFGFSEKTTDERSLVYEDMEDVWTIGKEYQPKEFKSVNKLPEALIKKIIQYSSNPGDQVCDFFMGNFTTAFVAKKMGRKVIGFELNQKCFEYFVPKLLEVEFGCDLLNEKQVHIDLPANQGKPLSNEDIELIQNDYQLAIKTMSKKNALQELSVKYGRGRWSLERIIKRNISIIGQEPTT